MDHAEFDFEDIRILTLWSATLVFRVQMLMESYTCQHRSKRRLEENQRFAYTAFALHKNSQLEYTKLPPIQFKKVQFSHLCQLP